MDKKGLARALKQVATAIELTDPNPFRARAYQNAARAIETSPYSLEELVLENKARGLKGIGPAMLERIEEYYKHGQLLSQQELLESVPVGLWELLTIPGLGTKRVRTLRDTLEVTSISELEYACHENRLLELPGFGPKMQANVLSGIHEVRARAGQVLLPEAVQLANHWLGQVRGWPGVVRAEITGDVRRCAPVTNCVALLLAVDGSPQDVLAALRNLSSQLEGTESGLVEEQNGLAIFTADLPSGPDLKIYLCPIQHFAYYWLLTTGSEAHLVALRSRGFDDRRELRQAPSEEVIYEQLGLEFVPPVLREDGEEVAWAATGQLPVLVQASDIPGVLHIHTTYSDGAHSLPEMAVAAAERGYSYLGIADHSQTASYAGGLTPERVQQQWREIETLNRAQVGARLLKGIESDILPSGALDYDEGLLDGFDFVIASVHSSLRQPGEQMMQRLLTAIAHPAVTILGHPTNRLLLGRAESAVDMPLLLQEATRHGKAMELNANPHRLDLDWTWCRVAKRLGVKIAINPDAHRINGLEDIHYGLLMAQKAGLTRDDIFIFS